VNARQGVRLNLVGIENLRQLLNLNNRFVHRFSLLA
jgi:hypothetical protein